MREDYYLGKLTRFDVEQKLNGTYAFLKQGDTKQMMRYLSDKYTFTRDKEKYNKDRTYMFKKKKRRSKEDTHDKKD